MWYKPQSYKALRTTPEASDSENTPNKLDMWTDQNTTVQGDISSCHC